jgi:hypothetical protein
MLFSRLNDAVSVQLFFGTFVRTLLSALGGAVPEEASGDCVALVEQAVHILKDRWQHSEETNQFADALVHLAETVVVLQDSIRTATATATASCGTVSGFQMLVSTAESWVLLGFLQVVLYADLGLMDPVVRRRLKLQYASEEVGIVSS